MAVAIGRPFAASAPGATVIVWYVPAVQAVDGRTVRIVCVPFQLVRTAVAGSTVSEASTLRVSIASLNVMSTAAWRPVDASIDRNAAFATPLIGCDGGVARVATGRERPSAAT